MYTNQLDNLRGGVTVYEHTCGDKPWNWRGDPPFSSWLLTESLLDFRVEMNPGSLSVYKTH